MNGAYPFPDGRTYVARTLVLLDDRQRLFGDQLELGASFTTGPVRHDLLAGFEIRSLTDRFTQDVAFLPPIDLLAPVETAQPPFATVPYLAQKGDSRALVLAPYVVDRLRFSPKLQAFVGARLDVLDYEDPPNATERDDTRFNPMLGLTFSPTTDLALHASWGTASAPPSTQVVGPREPEQSWQAELGAKLALSGGKGSAGVAIYQLERDNIAIPDSTGLSRQTGDQRSRGVEVDLSVKPSPGWVTTASYAYTDAELTSFSELVPLQPPDFVVIDRSGNRAPFAPRHIFSLWTSKRFDGGLGVALGLRSLSDQFVGEDNRYSIAGYTTLDAMVSYESAPAPAPAQPPEPHRHGVRHPRLRLGLRHPGPALRGLLPRGAGLRPALTTRGAAARPPGWTAVACPVDLAQALARGARGRTACAGSAPLAPFTTFRIGGPADLLAEVRSADEALLALRLAREARCAAHLARRRVERPGRRRRGPRPRRALARRPGRDASPPTASAPRPASR